MRHYHGTLSTFKELMDEVFYDWGMTAHPQQINKTNGGYWINKTEIFQELDENDQLVWTLSYKTTNFKIEDSVMSQFKTFFEFYENDTELYNLLNYVENCWHKHDFIVSNNKISLGKLEFLKAPDLKYYIQYENVNLEISKKSYQKINKFVEMITLSTTT